MNQELNDLINRALDDLKVQDPLTLDVSPVSDVTDTLIIASGSSNRHVKSLAGNVVKTTKALGIVPIGIEGMDTGDWVLVDYGDTVIHVMLPQTRLFYDLEKLWMSVETGSKIR
ncbi:MAG: ribosome-associated protein [Cellvibrionaceae bacterium]|jgi:ribosome-associated protein